MSSGGLNVNVPQTAGSTSATIVSGATAAHSRMRAPLDMPSFVSDDELFYWSRRWREGESESAAARQAGEVRSFEDGDSLVRWLLDDE